MASVNGGFGRFRPDSAGISSIFRGSAMQGLLHGIVDPIGASANAGAREFARERHHGRSLENDPYEAGVRVGRGTAFGYVNVNNSYGDEYESETHALSSRNH